MWLKCVVTFPSSSSRLTATWVVRSPSDTCWMPRRSAVSGSHIRRRTTSHMMGRRAAPTTSTTIAAVEPRSFASASVTAAPNTIAASATTTIKTRRLFIDEALPAL